MAGRRTKSVKKVIEAFEQIQQALSAIELIEKFKSDMNKTTVYRILDRLEEEGLLHSFKGKDGLQWYAKCKGCSASHHSDLHPHFQCKDCGKTECLSFDLSIPIVSKHKIERAELLLIGQCEDCIS